MEPLSSKKRKVAVYVPYRSTPSGELEFYLQKRDMNAPTHAGVFSMFGGGIEEGEELNEALMREIREELRYEPVNPVYLMRCERSVAIFHVFIEEVGSDFEQRVDVQEGEYGKFITIRGCKECEVSAICMLVVTDIQEWLNKAKRG